MSTTYDAINWQRNLDGEGNLVSVQLRATALALVWPDTDEVLKDVQFGPADDVRTGTLEPSTGDGNDAIPRFSAAVPGDGTATLSVSNVEAADVVRVAYRLPHGDWTIAASTRTGPGALTVSSLRNDSEYEFCAFCTRDGFPSQWTPTVRLSPAADAPANTRAAQLLLQRDAIAEAHLTACKNMGVIVSYTPANGVTISGLYALSEMGDMSTGLLGGGLDDEPLTLHIPRQTDFPPARFLVGDTVTMGTTTYAVQAADGNAQNLTLSSVFTLRIDRVASTGSLL